MSETKQFRIDAKLINAEVYWKAVYNDGTVLSQFNEDGSENKYLDIDRSKIAFFELFAGTKLIFRLHLEEGRRLICRRRVELNIMTGKTESIFLVGWQQTVNGSNIQDIAYIFPDGHVELAGKWKEHRIFCEPVLLECEKNGLL